MSDWLGWIIGRLRRADACWRRGACVRGETLQRFVQRDRCAQRMDVSCVQPMGSRSESADRGP